MTPAPDPCQLRLPVPPPPKDDFARGFPPTRRLCWAGTVAALEGIAAATEDAGLADRMRKLATAMGGE